MSPREEANATNRAFARYMRDMFVALLAEGFTEQQALLIISQAMTASILANGPGGGAPE